MTRYFDISDLVRFAHSNRTLSGIQRVQVRVIRHIANSSKTQDELCIYATGRFSRLMACRAADLFARSEYDAEALLGALGLEDPGKAFTKRELYEYLAQFPKKSFSRVVTKLALQLLGFCAPPTARAWMGLPPKLSPSTSMYRAKTWPVRRLRSEDQLVMIGTNWNVTRLDRIAAHHRRQGGSVVQVIYDLIPHVHPEYSVDSIARKFNRFLLRSLRWTSRYICISEATKRELQAYLVTTGHNIESFVLPLAHEFEGYPRNCRQIVPTDEMLEMKTSEPFVLCVGTIEIRKNGIALLRAWQRLLADGDSTVPVLVFAGKYGWKVDAFRSLLSSDSALAAKVRIIDRPTDGDLANLYARCLFTAYPSLSEGWGLPVGEAAWFGKFTIASPCSSIPEVCGRLVEYVAPDDVASLADSVKRAVMDEPYRHAREQAIERAQLRSWTDVAAALQCMLDR